MNGIISEGCKVYALSLGHENLSFGAGCEAEIRHYFLSDEKREAGKEQFNKTWERLKEFVLCYVRFVSSN